MSAVHYLSNPDALGCNRAITLGTEHTCDKHAVTCGNCKRSKAFKGAPSNSAAERVETYATKHRLTNPADLALMTAELSQDEADIRARRAKTDEITARLDAMKIREDEVREQFRAQQAEEDTHAVGREGMLCGQPFDGLKGSTRMEYVTCEACKSALTVRTADGVEIIDGLPVWDYDLNAGRVDLSTLTSDGWFNVVKADGSRSLMNGTRVAIRHPFSRRNAADEVNMPAPTVPLYDMSTPLTPVSDEETHEQPALMARIRKIAEDAESARPFRTSGKVKNTRQARRYRKGA